MNEFLDPKNRKEATIIIAGVALHALLSNSGDVRTNKRDTVVEAFHIAAEFMKQAEALKA